MDLALGAVAETLAAEFGDLRSTTVVAVLSDCVDEYPYDGSHFIEQAARARLSLLRRPQRPWPAMSGEDSLDVSLHDGELAEEVELTVRLIVAANEVEDRIAPEKVDEILGVTRVAGRTIPQQSSRRL
jgi:hypothetical protein